MPARSLRDMALSKAYANIDRIVDLGDLEEHLALPILQRVQRAEQLYTIEQHSPHLRGKTRAIWIRLIERDAGKHAETIKKPNVRVDNWLKTYKCLVARHEQDKKTHNKELEARQRAINKQKEANKAILDLDAKICVDNSTKRKHPKSAYIRQQEKLRATTSGRVIKPSAPNRKSKPSTIQKLIADVKRDQARKGLSKKN